MTAISSALLLLY